MMSERPASVQHLGVEQLAAYLDGKLAHTDRERATAHLAECEECYELFAETARFLREEERDAAGDGGGAASLVTSPEPAAPVGGRVLRPAGERWRRRTGWTTAGVAAAAAVATVLVWTPAGDVLRTPQAPSLADLAASLPPAEDLSPVVAGSWERHGWRVMRGTGPSMDPEHERAFQLGVRVVEMEIALSAGDRELARSLTFDLDRLLAGAEPLRAFYADRSGIRGRLEAGEPPQSLVELHREGDGLLVANPETDYPGFVDGFWYALGKWAGAAHLAAAAGDSSFFADPTRRRELRHLAEHELPSEMAPTMARLVELIGSDAERRLPEIERELSRLIAEAGGGEAEVG